MPDVHADEAQKAWLRMNVEGSTYVSSNPDPWISESYYMTAPSSNPISLGITVTNAKGKIDVNQIVLVIVTNKPGIIQSIAVNSVVYNSITWKTGDLTMKDNAGTSLGVMPQHGVYNDPSANWMEHRSANDQKLAPGASMLFNVQITFNTNPTDVKFHFDTYGWIPDTSRSPPKGPVIVDDTLDAAFSPFSHDVTLFVPEFPLTEIASAVGVCSYLLIARRKRRT